MENSFARRGAEAEQRGGLDRREGAERESFGSGAEMANAGGVMVDIVNATGVAGGRSVRKLQRERAFCFVLFKCLRKIILRSN